MYYMDTISGLLALLLVGVGFICVGAVLMVIYYAIQRLLGED